MTYKVLFTDRALKALERIDRHQVRIILAWVGKNLAGCANPRIHGKALTGDLRGYWRYRVGAYRLIAEINDREVRITIINAAHRKEIYESFN